MYRRALKTSVLWPSLGNHDTHSVDPGTETGPYFDSFTLPRSGEAGGLPSGTEKYYSFDYGSIPLRGPGFLPLQPISNRSHADLAGAGSCDHVGTWLVAHRHHPPYSKGLPRLGHGGHPWWRCVSWRFRSWRIMESDLVLGGHSHAYERSFLLDSHYGASDSLAPAMILDGGDGRPGSDGAYIKPTGGLAPHEGAVYVVAGSSGKLTGGPLDHPAMFHSELTLGSLILDVEGPDLKSPSLHAAGSVGGLLHHFKAGPGPLFADGFESGDSSRPGLRALPDTGNRATLHLRRVERR